MKKKHCLNLLLFALGFLLFVKVKAQQQNFMFKAVIDTIRASQFYKIGLTPGITSKCQQTLSDIRINDADGKEIAYILKEEIGFINEQSFVQLPIICIKKENDKQTHITLENKIGIAISKLWVITTNTDAQRIVDVVGSNNQKDWFIVKEKLPLSTTVSSDSTAMAHSISLPLSNYKYYQIIFLGKDLLPPNIIKIGTYKNDAIEGQFVDNPLPKIIQNDSSNKHSYVQLQFDTAYQIDKLLLAIGGVKYFKRSVTVYTVKNKQEIFLQNFFISSDVTLSFPINTHSNKLLLVIDNEDNQPLKVTTANTYQLRKYLLTYLEANKSYQLLFGDSTLVAPKYDLSFFKDSINNQNTVSLAVGSIESMAHKAQMIKPARSNTKFWLIWLAIGITLVILLLLVKNMLQQLNKNNSSL